MSTRVEITLSGTLTQERAEQVFLKTAQAMKQGENLLSKYNPQSSISYLNRHASSQKVKVLPEVFKILLASQHLSQETGGAFDISISPLLNLWREKAKQEILPTGEEIQMVRQKIGYQRILLDELNQEVYFTHPELEIDLGGIAKGYIVDKGIEVLKKMGIKSALINAGGDIYALGKKNLKRPWRVGIQYPEFRSKKLLGVVKLTDRAIATSGNYERFFEIKGRKFGHIINPFTGWPVEDVLSVTILAPSALEADAWATAVFVLGEKEGMKFINSKPYLEGIIVVRRGQTEFKILLSRGLDEEIVNIYPSFIKYLEYPK
jgi:thiamine biosynthesis lipoprotein